MGRDPRGNSAFDSGMRGREKPKVKDAHGGTYGQEKEGHSQGTDGTTKQGPDAYVGNPDGVNLNDSAYSSGMRGMEKPKQKAASGEANKQPEEGSTMGGESKQGPNTIVGHPTGHNDAEKGARRGTNDGTARSAASDAYGLGNDGNAVNSSEQAAEGHVHSDGEGILGEEDDTHINIRIPKASLKRKASGLQTS